MEEIWVPNYGQERPSNLQIASSLPDTQTSTNNLTAPVGPVDFNFPFHVGSQLSSQIPHQSTTDAGNLLRSDISALPFRDGMLHPTPAFGIPDPNTIPHQPNILSNLPFSSYFGISDIDYHFEPLPLDENIVNSNLVYKDIHPETSMYNNQSVNTENLLINHINPVFHYPMTSLDSAQHNSIKSEPIMKPPNIPQKNGVGASGLRVPLHCQVCQATQANGLHFGARTCAACAAFFRRTVSDDKQYSCKRNQRCNNASKDGTGYRKICRACRLKRCLDIGMLPENVQHKRARNESSPPQSHFEKPKALPTYENTHQTFVSHPPFYT
ncbi:unnamed protein product [Auanema sp. JU1783]|nr:unnamed protein product [Auanema sp. JU1783]